MAHLSQGYIHAHAVYGAAIANQPPKDNTTNEQQEAYRKAIKSIQGTLEKPDEYYETFVIKEILKIGSAYQSLRNEINKWSRLKNRLKANAKNKELGIYVTVLQQSKMYETLSKLLSPTVGHTTSIQAAACKTLSLIVFRPNRYRDAEWYHKKQKIIALKQFNINGSIYTVLLLISHILNNYKLNNINLICYSLQLLSNLVNHNSDVILAINKQFTFISMIFKILNHDLFFELTLKKQNKHNKIAILTLINALNAILNMSQHNDTNRIQFCEMNGWQIICKCLKHNCMQIRQLSLCFINSICVSSKLSAKYFLNTTFDGCESFKILLDIILKICNTIDNDINIENMKGIDDLLCTLICSLTCLCNDNMIGYRKFCMHKAWEIIRKLLQTINNFTQKQKQKNHQKLFTFSHTLNLQIFSLLSCFNVPLSFDKWKEFEWNVMFKNESTENKKKLTMKQRKLKQKKDELTAQNEYKKTQRICKEIIGMLGGYIEEGEEGDIILKYLFESLSISQYVIGAMCALGILCKYKHNGNIIRLNQIIEIIKRENTEKYKLSLQGLKDKMLGSFINIKFQFIGNKDFNQLIYFISAINDIIDAISISTNNNNNNNNGKQIRDLLIKSNVIYVYCMVITRPSNKFFIHHQQQQQYRNNNKRIDYKSRFEQIHNLKLNACSGLAKIIKYDINMQMLFGQWLKNMNASLKDLAMDPVDNSLLQIAITHVIQAGCFKPVNNQNIKQLRAQNIEHLLNQLYKQIQITSTVRNN